MSNTLGKGLESLIPPKKNNLSSGQIFRQSAQQNNDAPFLLPLTDTEEYHKLAPAIPAEAPSQPLPHEEPLQSSPIGSSGQKEEKFQPLHQKHKEAIFHIEVDKIKPNPFQPRKNFDQETLKDLAASIREVGVLQPIIVSKIDKETENGTDVEYQLIAGERRLMASKMAGLERIPAIIKHISQKSHQMEIAIIENLQRQNLDSIETARAYSRLSDEFGMTQREIAARLGKSRETVANAMRLLNLPTEIQDAVAHGKINESQARLILTIEDLAKQMAVFRDIMANNLSVRELKNRIRRESSGQNINNQPLAQTAVNPEINYFQDQLAELLGAPVKIEQQGEKGKIVISFYSPEEIKGIIEKIQK